MVANELLGERIKHYRMSLRLTQHEFAKRLGVTGASVSAYENGTRQPSFDVLIKIANILNTTTDDLLGRTKNVKKSIDVSNLTETQILTIKDIVFTYEKYNQMSKVLSELKNF